MTVEELQKWLDGQPDSFTEVRVIRDASCTAIEREASPIIATLEPVAGAFPFIALVIEGP